MSKSLMRTAFVGACLAFWAGAQNIDTVCLIDQWNTLMGTGAGAGTFLDSLEISGDCDSVVFATKSFGGVTLPVAMPVASLSKVSPCSLRLSIVTRPDTFLNVCETSIRAPAIAALQGFSPLLIAVPAGRGVDLFYRLPATPGQASIVIYGPTGRSVKRFSGITRSGKVRWNAAGMPAGRYVSVLRTKEGVQSVPFVLQF